MAIVHVDMWATADTVSLDKRVTTNRVSGEFSFSVVVVNLKEFKENSAEYFDK